MKTQIILATATLLLFSGFAMAQDAEKPKTEVQKIRTIEVTENGETVFDTTFTVNNDEMWGFYGPRGSFGRVNYSGTRQFNGPRGEGYRWMDENAEWRLRANAQGDSTRVLSIETPCGLTREFEMSANFVPGQGKMSAGKGQVAYSQGRMNRPRSNNDNTHRFAGRRNAQGFGNAPEFRHNNIVSYEKEELKDGTEKITIIRKKNE